MDTESLSHTQWNCKYHIVFAPRYRRQVIYGKIKGDIGKILRTLCEYKKVEIIEANACPDHVHMLVSIPPKISVSSFMGYLKGKSSLMIFDRHANLKYKYGNRHFWCRGYYVKSTNKQYNFIAISMISSNVNIHIMPVLIPNIRPFNAKNIILEADNKPHIAAIVLVGLLHRLSSVMFLCFKDVIR